MTNQLPDRVTVPSITAWKFSRPDKKISALTCYDYSMARLLDQAGVDLILVGDSLGSVIQGLETTLPVTLDEMIYHSRCVVRGVRRALVVGDLPFMSYQASTEQALISAGKLLKEGGVSAVKLEGGLPMVQTIKRLVDVDIPVMGHVGLTPQSVHRMGGYKVQGRESDENLKLKPGTRERIIEDALAVADAGAFSLVIEGVPADLAQEITNQIAIPTIGIGAGAGCDGQILVVNDLLGLNPDFTPKFVKKYHNLAVEISLAVRSYLEEVNRGQFPGPEHSFKGGGVDRPQLKSSTKLKRLSVAK